MPTPPKKPANWGRVSKTLAFWVIVILIPVAFLQFTSGSREPAPDISYSRYSQELERNNIKRVVVQGEEVIVGEFNAPVAVGSGARPASRFTVQLPVSGSEDEVKRLRERNVDIKAEKARASR